MYDILSILLIRRTLANRPHSDDDDDVADWRWLYNMHDIYRAPQLAVCAVLIPGN